MLNGLQLNINKLSVMFVNSVLHIKLDANANLSREKKKRDGGGKASYTRQSA